MQFFQYARQRERQRLDKDFAVAWVRVYRCEINEEAKTLRLWVRRKRGNRKLECSGCGRRTRDIAEVCEREVRDLPWSEFPTRVVIELYRVRCPECRIREEKVLLLPGKPRSVSALRKRWDKPVRVLPYDEWPRQFGLAASTVLAIDLRCLRVGRRGDVGRPCD